MVETGAEEVDVILQADENVSDLRAFHFKKHWQARNGEPGRGSGLKWKKR